MVIKHTFPLGVHAITLVITDSSGQTYSDDVIINVVSNIKEFFTEMFSSYNFDLSYKAIMFTPTADGTSYDACLQDITQLPTDPVGGTRMVMTDDSYKLVSLKNQKTVSIFGSRVSDLYICSNGYITFTEADISDSVSLSHHFAAKRISCLLNNLNFLDDSTVDYQQLEDRVVVNWISVK